MVYFITEMHAAIVIAVAVEAILIAILFWRVSNLSIDVDAVDDHAECIDQITLDIDQLKSELRELAKVREVDSKELSARISEIAGAQEKIRRRAAQPGSSGFAFESVRGNAEKNARKLGDNDMAKLVALAEGPEA